MSFCRIMRVSHMTFQPAAYSTASLVRAESSVFQVRPPESMMFLPVVRVQVGARFGQKGASASSKATGCCVPLNRALHAVHSPGSLLRDFGLTVRPSSCARCWSTAERLLIIFLGVLVTPRLYPEPKISVLGEPLHPGSPCPQSPHSADSL